MTEKKHKEIFVLLTNDDGITASGLQALYSEMEKQAEVLVVAPMSEQSAVGHAITIAAPLRVWPFEKNGHQYGYAVAGTPADCVKIAYWALLKNKRKPDLVISGINLGSNTGLNAIYSGTVSAATEGTILGIPSFAISLTTYKNADFRFAAKFAGRLARLVLREGLPKGVYLNVNVPAVAEEHIKGVAVTVQGQAIYHEKYEKRSDPLGRAYYWLSGYKVDIEEDGNVDDGAILEGKISITPIHYDLTSYAYLDQLKTWNFD